jgi:hypothetical protein
MKFDTLNQKTMKFDTLNQKTMELAESGTLNQKTTKR